jgi:hypothetical protein
MAPRWFTAPSATTGTPCIDSYHVATMLITVPCRYHFSCVNLSEIDAEDIRAFSYLGYSIKLLNLMLVFLGIYICPPCAEKTGLQSVSEYPYFSFTSVPPPFASHSLSLFRLFFAFVPLCWHFTRLFAFTSRASLWLETVVAFYPYPVYHPALDAASTMIGREKKVACHFMQGIVVRITCNTRVIPLSLGIVPDPVFVVPRTC